MYIPSYFKNENIDEVRAFLKANSFGILISIVDNKPWGSHIPLELEKDPEGKEVVYGHISKANPQWKNFKDNDEVMMIFNGPHGYVSSSWYNHENVPTWNYIAVHVYGTLHVIEEDELLFSLRKLMEKYEASSDNPVRMDDFSDSTMKQIKGIVGFKVIISDIQAAYKLSQNRNDEDYHNVVDKLSSSKHPDQHNLSHVMKDRRS